jgi:hypothetical protein
MIKGIWIKSNQCIYFCILYECIFLLEKGGVLISPLVCMMGCMGRISPAQLSQTKISELHKGTVLPVLNLAL